MATQRELVEKLFKVALDVKLEERSAFLDRECNGNAELRCTTDDLASAAVIDLAMRLGVTLVE